MAARPSRQAVDLSEYPDLVIIYLGMRANTLRGVFTLLRTGPRINATVRENPDGLLLHENVAYGAFPPHLGMRQYWRDFDALERWSRSGTHAQWWRNMLANPRGVGFWHEAYFAKGGTEAVYVNMVRRTGLTSFGQMDEARDSMFSARRRLRLGGEDTLDPPVSERDFYGD